MGNRTEKEKYLLQSVNNTLKILELLMVRDGISLKEITDLTGFDKTSVFKMLYTLRHRGFVIKGDHARYHLGNRLMSFRHLSASRQNIADMARPEILRLWSCTQKTVLLGTLGTGDSVTLISEKTEKKQDSVIARIGAEMELHTNSMGKVLLAFLEEELQQDIINRLVFRPHTEHTVTSKEAFRKCLRHAKENGWEISHEENEKNHCDIAVPVFDYSGACVACLDIVTDKKSMERHVFTYRQELINAAASLSEKLGYKQ